MNFELTPVIVAFIGGIAGPSILIVLKWYFEKKPTDMILDTIQISNIITAKLEDIQRDFNADRVIISQFHNGGHFYPTGKSIAKLSIFYESLQLGIESIQIKYQNIPVHLFSSTINVLARENKIIIPNCNNMSSYVPLNLFGDDGKSRYIFAIRSIDDKFIGIMSVTYIKEERYLSDIEINKLSHIASLIGGTMMHHTA